MKMLRMVTYTWPSPTAFKIVYRYCRAAVAVFGLHYLRAPNKEDTVRILVQNAAREFFRYSWKHQLDALGLEELSVCLPWDVQGFWHGWINVLQCSPVFRKLVGGHAPTITYEINGNTYIKG
jgi:hypothetical protein